MTQVRAAREVRITPEMETVAEQEQLDVRFIQEGVASGKIVIPRNRNREGFRCCGIGQGLRIKVNGLIGTSSDRDHVQLESRKLTVAREAGADAVMDLSTGGDIDGVRRQTLAQANMPVGSVPIYQCAIEAIEKRGSVVAMAAEDMFAAINVLAGVAGACITPTTERCSQQNGCVSGSKPQTRVPRPSSLSPRTQA